MKKLIFTVTTLFLFSIMSVLHGKDIEISHIHWKQPPFHDIVMKTAKDFMAKHPNVKVKIQLYADADMPTKVRTALTAGGDVDTFAMPNMQSPWFMANDSVAEIMQSAERCHTHLTLYYKLYYYITITYNTYYLTLAHKKF